MSNLSTLQLLTGRKLGTQTSNIYDDDKKTYALNKARGYIIENYMIDEFVKEETITFTNGKATIPSNYLRHVRMRDSNNNVYTRVTVNHFDDNIPKTWCIKADSSDSDIRKIYVHPTSTTYLLLRYLKRPDDMASDSDESGFEAVWDHAHATIAASILLLDDQQFEAGTLKEREGMKLVSKALENQAYELNDTNVVQSPLQANNFLATNSDV